MEEESMLILIGIACILGLTYLLHYMSKQEGFEDVRMDLGDGDRGSDAWYEKGTRRANKRSGTIIKVNQEKEIVKPNQSAPTANAAPAIREVSQAPAPAQSRSSQAIAAQPAALRPTAAVAAQATASAQDTAPAQPEAPVNNRKGAPARSSEMPTTTGTSLEKTRVTYAPVDNSNIQSTESTAADIGPELTAANTVKRAIPQINSRVNEDMCRVVMNCGLTKL